MSANLEEPGLRTALEEALRRLDAAGSAPEEAHQIVLVRHGETAWSRSGQHTGRTDIPLLEDGQRMGRALEARPNPDLMEWNYGAYEGKTSKEIRATTPGWKLWKDGAPEGETVEQVGARVDRVVEEVRRVQGNVLLFSHGHLLRVLAARWLGQPSRSTAKVRRLRIS